MLPEGFAPENVREMDLNNRQIGREEGIEQSNGGGRIAGRIYDDTGGAASRLLYPADQFALMIGLPEIDRQAPPLGMLPTRCLDLRESLTAINLRLATAQQVQVGSVEDKYNR